MLLVVKALIELEILYSTTGKCVQYIYIYIYIYIFFFLGGVFFCNMKMVLQISGRTLFGFKLFIIGQLINTKSCGQILVYAFILPFCS
jgi:hypothetical protein